MISSEFKGEIRFESRIRRILRHRNVKRREIVRALETVIRRGEILVL
ncbi:hypothetical protein Z947_2506 [Sulfitobacter geojensis]|nr:hypothetical protein Z947_2506 [Sulfitobacter geojensis]